MTRRWSIVCGDVRDVLPTMEELSFDAAICDPPYEIGFMGKRCSARDFVASGESSSGWIRAGKYPSPAMFMPDVDRIIEEMNEHAADEGCPDSIDDPFEFKKGAEKALERLLAQWAKKYAKANFWTPVGEAILVVEKEETDDDVNGVTPHVPVALVDDEEQAGTS